jgi:hypothetical protein
MPVSLKDGLDKMDGLSYIAAAMQDIHLIGAAS